MKIHLTFYELLNVHKTMPNGIEKSIEYYMIKHKFYEQKPFFVFFNVLASLGWNFNYLNEL